MRYIKYFEMYDDFTQNAKLSEIKAYFKDIKHYILDKFVDNVINKNYN